jgi:hypothetical protein
MRRACTGRPHSFDPNSHAVPFLRRWDCCVSTRCGNVCVFSMRVSHVALCVVIMRDLGRPLLRRPWLELAVGPPRPVASTPRAWRGRAAGAPEGPRLSPWPCPPTWPGAPGRRGATRWTRCCVCRSVWRYVPTHVLHPFCVCSARSHMSAHVRRVRAVHACASWPRHRVVAACSICKQPRCRPVYARGRWPDTRITGGSRVWFVCAALGADAVGRRCGLTTPLRWPPPPPSPT